MLAFNSHMLKNTCYCYLKWTFKDLLLCYWHATKTNCKTICWQVSQFASASKMCELQLNTASHLNLCSVSVIQTNKLLLKESNHIIEIKLLNLGFLLIFGSYFQFPGKDNCLFCPITLLQEDYGKKVQGMGAISTKCVKNPWFQDKYRVSLASRSWCRLFSNHSSISSLQNHISMFIRLRSVSTQTEKC